MKVGGRLGFTRCSCLALDVVEGECPDSHRSRPVGKYIVCNRRAGEKPRWM